LVTQGVEVRMKAGQAREIAREWVMEHATDLPGFAGAYLAGSVTAMPDEATLPATSDVDVMVVLGNPVPTGKPGKFLYREVLLEVTYMSGNALRTPEQVLGHYHLAGSFRTPSIIADPAGHLTALQAAVAKDFVSRRWVERRCEQARDTVVQRLDSLDASAPFHEQVVPWLFAAGGMPHVLLVAGLRNPTVRRRYEAVHDLLVDYGHAASYPELLALLGCAAMSRERVAHHLDVLSQVFDATVPVVRSPFLFAADITASARPVAIDGSREMIARGHHREAIFWMVATFSRCMQILHADAPSMASLWNAGYRDLLGDLGIVSFADLQRRGDEIRSALPRTWEVAEAIIDANPEIRDEER
jgi:hypothetical protein